MAALVRRTSPLVLIGVAACNQMTTAIGPESADQGPALVAGNQDKKAMAQHLANLREIEKAQLKSLAEYPALVAAWNARKGGKGATGAPASGDPFVACAPLPFDGEAQIVGPQGGVFVFGPHTLTVPAGALTENVGIGVMVTSSLKTEVTLLPHGTQFAAPVQLRLAYPNCDAAATHRVAYINDQDTILEWASSVDNQTAGYVDASLTHFSQYAIAY